MLPYQDLTQITDNAYKLANIIGNGNYSDILYYEFHEEINPETTYNCLGGLESFCERAGDFNKIFMTYYRVDEAPAQIHVAIKIANKWFIARNCGSNYYLGFGPTGILKLREACLKKNIAAFLSFDNFDQWIKENLGNLKIASKPVLSSETKRFESLIKEFRTIINTIEKNPAIYQKLNEEGLRDILLTLINKKKGRMATAETKNCLGKTDIHIPINKGLNEIVFELKIWNGLNSILNSIKQLEKYLRPRNKYAGIIIFSTKGSFDSILVKIDDFLKNTYKMVALKKESINEFRIYLKTLDGITEVHFFLVSIKRPI